VRAGNLWAHFSLAVYKTNWRHIKQSVSRIHQMSLSGGGCLPAEWTHNAGRAFATFIEAQ